MILYFIFFFIIVLTILDVLFEKLALRNLDFNRTISKNTLEIDEDFNISISLENNKILPVTYIKVVEELPNNLVYNSSTNVEKNINCLFHYSTMFLLPFQKIKRQYKVHLNKRGRYFLSNVDLDVGDLLGFNTYTMQIEDNHEIIVFPKKIDYSKAIIPYGSTNGNVSVKRWIMEDPTLIVGVRNYTGFEPQHHIHWPSSLKTGDLMVKQFDFTTDNSVMIILNIETSRPLWSNIKSNKIEKSISITRGIIEDLHSKKIPYGFATNAMLDDKKFQSKLSISGYNTTHYMSILTALGKISYNVYCTFDNLLDTILRTNHKYGTYIIISPTIFDEDIKYINLLNKVSNKTIVISLDNSNLDNISKNILTYSERVDD